MIDQEFAVPRHGILLFRASGPGGRRQHLIVEEGRRFRGFENAASGSHGCRHHLSVGSDKVQLPAVGALARMNASAGRDLIFGGGIRKRLHASQPLGSAETTG
jgi:hypothetical protein